MALTRMRIYAISFVEWIGTGIFTTISTVYLVRIVGISSSGIGAGLAIAGGLAMITAVPIARLGDRYGTARVLALVNLARAAATLAFLAVDGWWTFLLVTIAAAMTEQAAQPLVQVLAGAQAKSRSRERTMAVQRTMIMVGLSVGNLIGAAAMGAPNPVVFRWLLVAGAMGYVAVAVLLRAFPRSAGPTVSVPSVRLVLKERRLIAFASYNALVSLWMPLLLVAFLLWVTQSTHAPIRIIGVLYAVNTVMCVVLQIPIARLIRTPRRSFLAYAASCLCTMLCCFGFVASAGGGGTIVVVFLTASVVVLTLSSITQVGAQWPIYFALAPEEAASQYLAVVTTGRAFATQVAGPALMTGVVLALGPAGWLGLAGANAVAALAPVVAMRFRGLAVPLDAVPEEAVHR